MDNRIADLVKDCTVTPCRSGAEVDIVKSYFHFDFPRDYCDFMMKRGGIEGFIGEGSYLILWPLQDLIAHNVGYRVREFCPDLVLIGTNGGEQAFAFDTSRDTPAIVEVPFIDLGLTEPMAISGTLLGFLEYLEAWE